MQDKDAYIRKLRQRKDEWNAMIDRLTVQADEAKAGSCDPFRKELGNLQKKCKEAERLYANMWTADEGVMKNLKSGVRDARDAMEAALRAARSRY